MTTDRFDPLAALADIIATADDGQGLTVGDVEALGVLHSRLSALMAGDATMTALLTAPVPYDGERNPARRVRRVQVAVEAGEWVRGAVDAALARYAEGAR